MKIGELSQVTGAPVETIRYYERTGLLPAPPRSGGNYRHYGESAVARLSFIRRCRSLDMSLDEIRTLLALADAEEGDCQAADAVIDRHLTHVRERLGELRILLKQLQALRAACAEPGSISSCGMLRQLGIAAENADNADTHVPGTHHAPAGSADRIKGKHPRRHSS
jgi:Cd(II)/Pb(II)-responsive transcriptional regulator